MTRNLAARVAETYARVELDRPASTISGVLQYSHKFDDEFLVLINPRDGGERFTLLVQDGIVTDECGEIEFFDNGGIAGGDW